MLCFALPGSERFRDDCVQVHESMPAIVPYGKPFRLTGERSNDRGGTVTSWRWTLVSR